MGYTRKWSIFIAALAVLVVGINRGWADDDDGPRNGQAVKQAIEDLFPGGRVLEVERETRVFRVYEVEVRVDGKVQDVTLLEDGTVLSVEQEVSIADLPHAVAEKVKQLTAGSKAEVEKVEHRNELAVAKIEPARTEYEVEYRVNRKLHKAMFAEDGTRLNGSRGGYNEDDEKYDDDDDREHERHRGRDDDDDDEHEEDDD